MPSGYEPGEKAPDGLQLPFRDGAIGTPTHRLRTGITDDSAQENRIIWSTTQITGLLAFRSYRQFAAWQICCVAVESQFLHGIKEGADIGYGLVGAAADQRPPQLSASGWASRH